MTENDLETIDIFGYSMGGYAALYLARHFPEKVGRIMTFGTKLNWTPDSAERETRMLNPEKIEQKVPQFAKALEAAHAPQDWKNVLTSTASMLVEMGANPPLSNDDIERITCPVHICVGDGDTTAGVEDTIEAQRHFPNAKLTILKDTIHPIERANIEELAGMATNFFK